jgi:eukaryotic-like serine/threonine-protein kinase
MPADLPATTLAGRYRIERELGAGGMATVYLARDLKHDRHVAVKVLSPELAATVGAERFLREIRITAGLQHTNILTLIDSGEWEDLLYYVMPFVDGESLRTHIARAGGALPTATAVLVLREMLDALAHAHRHGLVHRDIKPENVMLAERHALVLDFGVAKAVQVARADDARRTRAEAGGAPSIDALTTVGTSLGTPAYMAPEQAVGDTDVDHRADLYSVGVVAYELFTGHPPFRGRPNEVLAAHVTAAPPPLAELAPSLPPALARLVMQCLEKERERRPQSAEQMIEAIDAIMAPTVSRGPWTRLASRLGTRGATVTVSAAALLVLVSATLLLARARDTAWVRDTAVPELGRLIDASQPESALVVAERALAIAPGDPRVNELLPSFARTTMVVSAPAGARLSWTTYDDSTGWRDAGVAPATLRLPRSPLRMRLELAGHRPLW